MIELLQYLAAHQFTNFIASGGGRDFMRTISQECYGIPPERVIGSSVSLEFREVEGVGQIVHTAKLDLFDEGQKNRSASGVALVGGQSWPAATPTATSRCSPLPAEPAAPRLRLLVLHDDAEREFDYTAGAEKALERAGRDGWTVVSVKNDWKTVFDD